MRNLKILFTLILILIVSNPVCAATFDFEKTESMVADYNVRQGLGSEADYEFLSTQLLAFSEHLHKLKVGHINMSDEEFGKLIEKDPTCKKMDPIINSLVACLNAADHCKKLNARAMKNSERSLELLHSLRKTDDDN